MKALLTIALSAACISLYALPAYRGPIQVTQADGTQTTIYKHGDEHFHYITDEQNRWVKWEKGMLTKTEALSEDEIVSRRESSPMRVRQRQREMAIDVNLAPRGLVILANFSDLAFQTTNTREEFEDMMNKTNYTYQGATGSVKDYYRSQSFGAYDPVFDVVGPVTLDHPYKYYGQNGGAYNQDLRPQQMIIDACKKADTEWNVDFTQYDNDNDGVIDFVFVFYAGHGEADYSNSDIVWPHMFYVYNEGYGTLCKLDGKILDQYACSNELPYNSNTKHVGISTCCHEFSHVMGLPDMYNTQDENDYQTMGNWDIMDAGPYNNNGRTPPSYSGYERFFCGFVTPKVLNSPCNVTLTEIQRSGQVLLITATGSHNLKGNDPNPTTFYVLENRQKVLWDKYLPGHGMMVTKVQYSYNTWYNNSVNDVTTNHRIALQPADGSMNYSQYTGVIGDGGDTYPGTKNQTEYTPISNFPLTEISEKDSLIHFKFMGGGQEIELNATAQENDDLTIFATTESVIINGLKNNQEITVYNLVGQLVKSQTATATMEEIPLDKGIYIVKTGTHVNKIIIR